MKRKTARDFAPEVMALFDHYVHGAIDRRGFLHAAARFAVGGVTASMLLEALSPNFAQAQQVKPDDPALQTDHVEYATLGGYPGNEDMARELFQQLGQKKTREDFLSLALAFRAHDLGNGKLGVVGFCYGGAIANFLATKLPDLNAAVPFYGTQPRWKMCRRSGRRC